MFKSLVNEATVGIRIRVQGPLLIKAPGMGALDPTLPDSAFVRTWKDGRMTVYIPGSSVKGVVRSHAERLLRTWEKEVQGLAQRRTPWPVPVCDPLSALCLEHRKGERQGQVEDATRLTGQEAYSGSCPACRTFGNTQLAGRLTFSDLYPETGDGQPDPNQTETRAGVAISRVTQAAARGRLYHMEAVVRGAFAGRAHLRNFHLWQLGLLSQVLGDIDDNLVLLGGAKARGFGWVGAEVTELCVAYNRAALGPSRVPYSDGRLRLWGYGDLELKAKGKLAASTGSRGTADFLLLPPCDSIELEAPQGVAEERGLSPLVRVRITDKSVVDQVLERARGCLLSALEGDRT